MYNREVSNYIKISTVVDTVGVETAIMVSNYIKISTVVDLLSAIKPWSVSNYIKISTVVDWIVSSEYCSFQTTLKFLLL